MNTETKRMRRIQKMIVSLKYLLVWQVIVVKMTKITAMLRTLVALLLSAMRRD